MAWCEPSHTNEFRIFVGVSSERVIPFPDKPVAKAAQCPSCFTLNVVDPENNRQDGYSVTCLLCGTHYDLLPNSSREAA